MKDRALICGITGQDGSYLAQFLLKMGYDVWGTSRDVEGHSLKNLKTLGIVEEVHILTMIPTDFRSVFTSIQECDPKEVYFLCGQSSVGLSFEQPLETLNSITMGILNVLEAIRIIGKNIKLYNAGSSECYGDFKGKNINETTEMSPRSPYAVAKASAHWLVDCYRESYGLWTCTGILFNHESPLRSDRFVTQKIISTARRIKDGFEGKLTLGNIDIERDWGWAPDYVEAMWLMLQKHEPRDYVIATGKSYTIKDFVEYTFGKLGLDYKDYLIQDPKLVRPNELLISRADPSLAQRDLNWETNKDMIKVIDLMMDLS